MRVNACFQIIPRFVGRLGLELELGSGPHVMGRLESGPRVVGQLGSKVCVSSSFQIFILTAEGECHRLGGKLSDGEMSEGENVLHSPCVINCCQQSATV